MPGHNGSVRGEMSEARRLKGVAEPREWLRELNAEWDGAGAPHRPDDYGTTTHVARYLGEVQVPVGSTKGIPDARTGAQLSQQWFSKRDTPVARSVQAD